MDTSLSRFEQTCPDCDGRDFVDDFASGDLICKQCGLVLESHTIDARSEWRTFSDSDKTGSDPNRVGAPVNVLLPGGGLSTVIGKVEGDGNQSFSLSRLNARANQADRGLVRSFAEIGVMCDKLALTEAIRERACEIYKDYKDLKSLRGRKAVAFYSACIYMACKSELHPRTFKEINTAAPDTSLKEISRCFKLVLNEMQDTKRVGLCGGSVHPADYMKRFGSRLGFTHDETRACVAVANAAMPRNGRNAAESKKWEQRAPLSIAAAIIYLVSVKSKVLPAQGRYKSRDPSERVSLSKIIEVTQVSESTIIPAYKELDAEAHELLPVWFVHGKKKARKMESSSSVAAEQLRPNKRPNISK